MPFGDTGVQMGVGSGPAASGVTFEKAVVAAPVRV